LTCGESPLVEGRTIQHRLRQDLGLSPSVGIAANRLVAEIAACSPGLGAARGREPGSLTVAPPGEEMAFLAPLPTGCLPGLDAALQERLGSLGLHRIADLQAMPSGILAAHFGREGRRLYHLARGYEDTAALPGASAAQLFDHRLSDPEDLRRWTILLCSQVGRQLRASRLAARTIRLTIGHPDRPPTVLTGRLAQPGDVDQVLFLTALQALQNCRLPEEGVNSLELEANGLEEKSLQLPLLPDRSARRNEKLRLINNAANRIEGKHGEGVILVASVLNQEILSRLRGSRHGWAN
jgi:DNA polymerase-4